MSDQPICVTGASGYIGTALLHRLCDMGQSVVAISRSKPSVLRPGVRWIEIADSTGQEQWVNSVRGSRAVIHLAAIAHQKEQYKDDLDAFGRVNCNLAITIARASLSAGVPRFVFASSIGVHGMSSRVLLGPASPLAPAEPYAIAKRSAEHGLSAIPGMPCGFLAVVRPAMVYGRGSPGNLGRLLRLIDSGMPLPFGSLTNRRALLEVNSLCDLLVRMATYPVASANTFLAADSVSPTMIEVMHAAAKGMQRNLRLYSVPAAVLAAGAAIVGRHSDWIKLSTDLLVDVRLSTDTFEWQPCSNTLDQIAEVASYWSQNRARRAAG